MIRNFFSFQIGTFIFNNEKEKIKYNGINKTVSLWSYLNRPEILRTFLNPFYEPNLTVLWPSVAPQSIVSKEFFILLYHILELIPFD
jgi:myotubularin-related protein 9